MSCYIVDDRIINLIISGLNGSHGRRGQYCLQYEDLLPLLRAQGSDEERQALGQVMFEINCASVDYRYDDKPSATWTHGPDTIPGEYTYNNRVPCNIYSLLKAIECWTYQSCESDECRDHPVYKALEYMSHRIALDIVNSLPEYEAAEGW